jgi:hypothetical protein
MFVSTLPQKTAGSRDVVVLVQPSCLLLAERVRERIAPLLEGEPHRLVAVGRVLEHGNVDLICEETT